MGVTIRIILSEAHCAIVCTVQSAGTSSHHSLLLLYISSTFQFVTSQEKCDRIVELCLKYDERSRLAEYQFYRSDEAEDLERSGAVDMELAALHAKLRGGGDVLHRVCAIAAFAATGSRRCHEHILGQLETQNAGMGIVKEALEEFANLLDEGRQKKQLSGCLAIL